MPREAAELAGEPGIAAGPFSGRAGLATLVLLVLQRFGSGSVGFCGGAADGAATELVVTPLDDAAALLGVMPSPCGASRKIRMPKKHGMIC